MATWIPAQIHNYTWERFILKNNVPIPCPNTLREQIVHFRVTLSVVNHKYCRHVCQIEDNISLILRVIWHWIVIRLSHLSWAFKFAKWFSGLDVSCVRLLFNVFLKTFSHDFAAYATYSSCSAKGRHLPLAQKKMKHFKRFPNFTWANEVLKWPIRWQREFPYGEMARRSQWCL